MREKAKNDWLAKLVSGGKLTQQQADQLKAWLSSRPNLPLVGPKNADKLLKDGRITQPQYDAFQNWWKQKPHIPLPEPQKTVKPPFRGKGVPNNGAGKVN